jgi:hypothetical protein
VAGPDGADLANCVTALITPRGRVAKPRGTRCAAGGVQTDSARRRALAEMDLLGGSPSCWEGRRTFTGAAELSLMSSHRRWSATVALSIQRASRLRAASSSMRRLLGGGEPTAQPGGVPPGLPLHPLLPGGGPVQARVAGPASGQDHTTDRVAHPPSPRSPGACESAVVAEIESLPGAAAQPGLVALARVLATDVDDVTLGSSHPSLSRELRAVLEMLRGDWLLPTLVASLDRTR